MNTAKNPLDILQISASVRDNDHYSERHKTENASNNPKVKWKFFSNLPEGDFSEFWAFSYRRRNWANPVWLTACDK